MRIMAGALALGLAAVSAEAQTRVEFWHAFSGVNGEAVDDLAAMFNESQDAYEIVPVYTGNYTEGAQRLIAATTPRRAS